MTPAWCGWVGIIVDDEIVPFSKKGKKTNWIELFNHRNHLKWDNICHYEWKFRGEKEICTMLSGEQIFICNGKEIDHVSMNYCQHTPFSQYAHFIDDLRTYTWCIFCYILAVWALQTTPSLPLFFLLVFPAEKELAATTLFLSVIQIQTAKKNVQLIALIFFMFRDWISSKVLFLIFVFLLTEHVKWLFWKMFQCIVAIKKCLR